MNDNTMPAEQPHEDSVEDRLANILAPDTEQSTEPEAASEEPAEEAFEFEYEGEKFQLPKKLEKAVMQEKDYTQKSQSLAEMRKDVERQFAQIKLAQSQAQFQQSVKAETDQIAMIDAVLGEYSKLKWSDMGTDELVRKKLEMDQYKDMRVALDQSVQAKRAQFDQSLQQELDKIKNESRETLQKRLNWSEQTEAEVRAYVRELGITDAEYDGVFDPRHKQILWEAAQFRKLKANAQPTAQQVKSLKPTPTNTMSKQVKDKLAFTKAVKSAKTVQERSQLASDRLARMFEG